jgi:hypothetical protein
MAKRKPISPDGNFAREGYHLAGCIDWGGRVLDGYVVYSGWVWIRRSTLPEAQRWGWKATGQENGELIVVKR